MSTHYVAQLKIERVDKPDPGAGRSHPGLQPPSDKREISEVTMLTIKADDIHALTEKLSKHIALIEDD